VLLLSNTTDYQVIRQGEDTILLIDYEKVLKVPSIEDDPFCMSTVIDRLIEVKNVTKIVFSQKRDYEYDYSQTSLLTEVARLYNQLIKQKRIFSYSTAITDLVFKRHISSRYSDLQRLIFSTMKKDPIATYVELKRMLRHEKLNLDAASSQQAAVAEKRFISLITYLLDELSKTKLIKFAQPYLSGFKIGDRSIYRMIFTPTIKPDFMFTKLMSSYPTNGTELDTYSLDNDTEVTVFGFPDSVKYLYHMMPPEFKLSEEEYDILDTARTIMAEHKPKKEEFVDPERMREVFYNIGHDLIEELVNNQDLKFSQKKIDKLTKILVRYTVGFGLIEVLLSDEKIQDVSINSPYGQTPMFIVHQDYGDCNTNIVPTVQEAESWASKLRMISGRPLDEANQILDTEIHLPGATARVSAITRPLDPTGLAFSFRRHRDKPWTLPLFIKVKMISPLAAGLISFLIDGTRTLLVCGTRSSGKTSLLGSLLVEIMRRYRIITIEDTLELPTTPLRKLGYNVQPLKVSSALGKETGELSATDGIRSTLRLGDSALFVGEVRSKEAIALYEAMRVGASANVVAGTIHADSPYGVFDRVVNDIGVPKTSFKATDVIIVANPIKTAGGIKRVRRVTQITEVRKTWEEDPLAEKGFVDLLKYDVNTDSLQPTPELINGDSEVLKAVAASVKGLAGSWDAVWDNIQLRAKIKQALVDYSVKENRPDILEADFVIKSNDTFHNIVDKVQEEEGGFDPKKIYFEWEEWLKREVKRKVIK